VVNQGLPGIARGSPGRPGSYAAGPGSDHRGTARPVPGPTFSATFAATLDGMDITQTITTIGAVLGVLLVALLAVVPTLLDR
jgi:hypothetical protein